MTFKPFHKSWLFLFPLLRQEPLTTLFGKVLTEVSYLPKQNEIFEMFYTPLDEVKVVLVKQDPYTFSNINFLHLKEQGVLILNSALTAETGRALSHQKYWDSFIKKVIKYIAYKKPSVWLFLGMGVKNYISSVNTNPIHLTGYNENLIKQIPINDDWNYIVPQLYPSINTSKRGFFSDENFHHINTVLEKKNLLRINWQEN